MNAFKRLTVLVYQTSYSKNIAQNQRIRTHSGLFNDSERVVVLSDPGYDRMSGRSLSRFARHHFEVLAQSRLTGSGTTVFALKAFL